MRLAADRLAGSETEMLSALGRDASAIPLVCRSELGFKDRQARASRMILRLASADWTLDPLALTAGGLGTEAIYVPSNSSTLSE